MFTLILALQHTALHASNPKIGLEIRDDRHIQINQSHQVICILKNFVEHLQPKSYCSSTNVKYACI